MQSATSSEIKKAYRKKTLILHPDKNEAPDAEEQFRKVNMLNKHHNYLITANEGLRYMYSFFWSYRSLGYMTWPALWYFYFIFFFYSVEHKIRIVLLNNGRIMINCLFKQQWDWEGIFNHIGLKENFKQNGLTSEHTVGCVFKTFL